jgi:hypothetical protein
MKKSFIPDMTDRPARKGKRDKGNQTRGQKDAIRNGGTRETAPENRDKA